ncbi:MAG: hypothetical protein AAFP15_02785, partial [Bacteroidota bacterium]
MRSWSFLLSLALFSALLAGLPAAPTAAQTQADGYDPSWYEAGQPHIKLSVVEDGLYRVTGAE